MLSTTSITAVNAALDSVIAIIAQQQHIVVPVHSLPYCARVVQLRLALQLGD